MVKSGRRYRPAARSEVLEAAQALLIEDVRGMSVKDPSSAKAFLSMTLAAERAEIFGVLWLDNRHRVITWRALATGTIDRAMVYPREVVRSCIEHNAAACILAHNHPSGIAEPSSADDCITKRIQEALLLLDVRVLDHIIVCGGALGTYSYADHGRL